MIGGSDRVEEAGAILRAGGLVAFPTETVYGLGADARSARAVGRIFLAKGRPADHPLIVHLGDVSWLERWAVGVGKDARLLAEAFWPGALTLILHRAPGVPDEVTGGRETVGLRVPAQPIALALLNAFGDGIAAPSANRFGRVSPTRAEDVLADLGDRVDLVLDGGPCQVGVESTILDLTADVPQVLRPGGVDADALEAVLGRAILRTATGPSRAPGMLTAHYAPQAVVEVVAFEHVVVRAAQLLEQGLRVGVMSSSNLTIPGVAGLGSFTTSRDYARELYACLREADRRELQVVLAVPPPATGIGVAVSDRLRRAASSFSLEDEEDAT